MGRRRGIRLDVAEAGLSGASRAQAGVPEVPAMPPGLSNASHRPGSGRDGGMERGAALGSPLQAQPGGGQCPPRPGPEG